MTLLVAGLSVFQVMVALVSVVDGTTLWMLEIVVAMVVSMVFSGGDCVPVWWAK
jgi:hypothetical protein